MIKDGDIFITNQGCTLVVLEYKSYQKIKVKFLDKHGFEQYVSGGNLRKGAIGNPYFPSIFGVGYFGNGRFKSKVGGVETYEYSIWKHAMRRVYCEKYKEKYKTYEDCTIIEEWHNFQVFAEWFVGQIGYNERYHLDKDLLFKGNKHYSPDNCALVPMQINMFLTKRESKRGSLPIGVIKRSESSGYSARVNINGKKIWLGTYSSAKKAFTAYKTAKEGNAKCLAEKFKCNLDKRAYERLLNWKIEIWD